MQRPVRLLRVDARAELTEASPDATIARLRELAEADEEFAELVALHDSGGVLVVDLEVEVEVDDMLDGRQHALCRNVDILLERGDVPMVEKQVSELSTRDHRALAAQLRGRGLAIEVGALDEAFAHVTLGPRLLELLAGGAGGVP